MPNPTPADALAIVYSLRVEGNLEAGQLAEQIERACRAAVYYPDWRPAKEPKISSAIFERATQQKR